mgnify:CR=1 FL=1
MKNKMTERDVKMGYHWTPKDDFETFLDNNDIKYENAYDIFRQIEQNYISYMYEND